MEPRAILRWGNTELMVMPDGRAIIDVDPEGCSHPLIILFDEQRPELAKREGIPTS